MPINKIIKENGWALTKLIRKINDSQNNKKIAYQKEFLIFNLLSNQKKVIISRQSKKIWASFPPIRGGNNFTNGIKLGTMIKPIKESSCCFMG